MPTDPSRPLGRAAARADRLTRLRRLTIRDRQLLSWLAEHYVLSADQIRRAQFGSGRSARRRLLDLHRLEAVIRFVDVTTGSPQYLYTLGPLGLLVEPAIYHDPARPDARPARTSLERAERIVGSRQLAHLLGANDLFADLLCHARGDPDARLMRWWSEQHASAAYAFAGIHPDAHGIWQCGGRTVGFFLEHDNGTETLGTVLAKLAGYQRLAAFGPRYPVLLRLPGPGRERNLLQALGGVATAMPVATSLHGRDPATACWRLAADPGVARYLSELPSYDGPDNPATNPYRFTGAADF